MKKLFESGYLGYNESATKVAVYEFESEKECLDFYGMSHSERCSYFDVFDEWGYEVVPGASYHTYSFDISDGILVMSDRYALNV